jgi:hypothetical protein
MWVYWTYPDLQVAIQEFGKQGSLEKSSPASLLPNADAVDSSTAPYSGSTSEKSTPVSTSPDLPLVASGVNKMFLVSHEWRFQHGRFIQYIQAVQYVKYTEVSGDLQPLLQAMNIGDTLPILGVSRNKYNQLNQRVAHSYERIHSHYKDLEILLIMRFDEHKWFTVSFSLQDLAAFWYSEEFRINLNRVWSDSSPFYLKILNDLRQNSTESMREILLYMLFSWEEYPAFQWQPVVEFDSFDPHFRES